VTQMNSDRCKSNLVPRVGNRTTTLYQKGQSGWIWTIINKLLVEQFTRYCSQRWVCEQFQRKTGQILGWSGS